LPASPAKMSLNNRKFCASLVALFLLAAQALLSLHDVAPESHTHAAECQICAHGSALGYALPGHVIAFYPHAADARPPLIHLRQLPSNKYQTPTARAPPQIASF
jgi:hypothetical protein